MQRPHRPSGAGAQARRRGRGSQALVTNFEGGRSMFNSAPATGFTAFLFAVRSGSIEAVQGAARRGRQRQRHAVGRLERAGRRGGQRALAAGRPPARPRRRSEPRRPRDGTRCTRRCGRAGRTSGSARRVRSRPARVDSLDVIKKMIARGANVNARMSRNGMKDGQRNRLNRLGATPFLLAAKNTDVEVMKRAGRSGRRRRRLRPPTARRR